MELYRTAYDGSAYSDGNGSLMRIMPACLYVYEKQLSVEDVVKMVHDVSGITYIHLRTKIASDYIISMLVLSLMRMEA